MAPNDKTLHCLEESVMILNNRAEFHQVIPNVFIKETKKEKKIWNSGSFFAQKLSKNRYPQGRKVSWIGKSYPELRVWDICSQTY